MNDDRLSVMLILVGGLGLVAVLIALALYG
jgi:hypothetical protein